MLRNRLCYFAVLAGAVLFFFCYYGYLSFYTLAVTLSLPILSLLASLPGALGARAVLSVSRPAVRKGETIELRITVDSRSRFPSGRAKATLTVRNTLTGELQKERFYFTAGKEPLTITHALASPTCGQIVCELSHGWVCDYIGLFALPLRLKKPCRQSVLFYPAVYHPSLLLEQTAIPEGEGERYSQVKPGHDPSELFAFREYHEGDKLSQIHWKLSQKAGDLLVREFSLPIADHIFFLLEPNGPGEEVDALLDVFATLSAFLSEQESYHRIGVLSQLTGELLFREAAQPEDLFPILNSLLLNDLAKMPDPSAKHAAGGKMDHTIRLKDGWEAGLPSGAYHVIYLCCRPDPAVFEGLRERLPNARVSILTTAGPDEKLHLPDGANLVPVRSNTLPDALNGFRL